MLKKIELAIIGGGPAGMAAAVEASKNGIKNILIIERENELGGILNQCIHNGFGLHIFGEELTGPEYANRFIDKINELGIKSLLNTTVLDITKEKTINVINSLDGLIKIQAKAIVLSMGCRERAKGALNIPGHRPSGVYSAGTAQKFVNIDGYLPGKKVIILGSGDIGLIMARRMTLEGAKVEAVCELMPFSGGLARNITQCLDDFDIPLLTSHTITKLHGTDRLEGVTISKVDEKRQPIVETEKYIECDTLLLSVGLIPENELSKKADVNISNTTGGPIVNQSMETSVPGIFACGNVVHVHDLVDYVTQESTLTGRCAAKYIQNNSSIDNTNLLKTQTGKGVRYIVPHLINKEHIQNESKLYFRVDDVYKNSKISLLSGDLEIFSTNKIKLTPGEMETINLSQDISDKITNLDITIKVERNVSSV